MVNIQIILTGLLTPFISYKGKKFHTVSSKSLLFLFRTLIFVLFACSANTSVTFSEFYIMWVVVHRGGEGRVSSGKRLDCCFTCFIFHQNVLILKSQHELTWARVWYLNYDGLMIVANKLDYLSFLIWIPLDSIIVGESNDAIYVQTAIVLINEGTTPFFVIWFVLGYCLS